MLAAKFLRNTLWRLSVTGWLWLACAISVLPQSQGPVLVVQPSALVKTIAGNGTNGFSGDKGPATSAAISAPTSMAADAAGNLYFADRDNNCIRRIDTSGVITTVAGSGFEGFGGDGGPATSAFLNSPTGVAVDSVGNLYIADTQNQRIRMVSQGIISTIAGTGVAGFCGDGGPATSGCLFWPRGIALDTHDNLYIADSGNNRIRLISKGLITTVAGSMFQGNLGDGGPATSATLNLPIGVFVDPSGVLYIADSANNRIRSVSSGIISAFAGSGAEGDSGDGASASTATLTFPNSVRKNLLGAFLIADSGNDVIRQVLSGNITSVAGIDLEGPPIGTAPARAVFDMPSDALPQATGFYVADVNNNRIRLVSYSALNFANQFAGTTSAAQPITLSNSGNASAAISTLQFSGTDFRMVSGGSCPSSFPFHISPGTSCTIQVVFAPSTAATYSEIASFTDNAPGSPQSVMLAGIGVLNSTTLALAAKPAMPVYGDAITFTATLLPGVQTSAPLPAGTVTFTNGSVVFATAAASQGAAQAVEPLLPAGSHAIDAGYAGNAFYAPSSGSLNVAVAKATPAISLISSPSPISDGFPLVLTARVQSSASIPTGTVDFVDSAASLGTVPLNAQGTATFDIASLASGAHSIIAMYSGDSNFNPATSSALSTGSGSFSISVSSLVPAGTYGTATVTVTPIDGFHQTVNLACTSLPEHTSCSFTPASVTLNGTASVPSKLTIATMSSCTVTYGPLTAAGGIGMFVFFLLGLSFRRRRLFAALAAGCLLMSCVGCVSLRGVCYAPSGSYTITVVGSSQIGSSTVKNIARVTFSVGGNGIINN